MTTTFPLLAVSTIFAYFLDFLVIRVISVIFPNIHLAFDFFLLITVIVTFFVSHNYFLGKRIWQLTILSLYFFILYIASFGVGNILGLLFTSHLFASFPQDVKIHFYIRCFSLLASTIIGIRIYLLLFTSLHFNSLAKNFFLASSFSTLSLLFVIPFQGSWLFSSSYTLGFPIVMFRSEELAHLSKYLFQLSWILNTFIFLLISHILFRAKELYKNMLVPILISLVILGTAFILGWALIFIIPGLLEEQNNQKVSNITYKQAQSMADSVEIVDFKEGPSYNPYLNKINAIQISFKVKSLIEESQIDNSEARIHISVQDRNGVELWNGYRSAILSSVSPAPVDFFLSINDEVRSKFQEGSFFINIDLNYSINNSYISKIVEKELGKNVDTNSYNIDSSILFTPLKDTVRTGNYSFIKFDPSLITREYNKMDFIDKK